MILQVAMILTRIIAFFLVVVSFTELPFVKLLERPEC